MGAVYRKKYCETLLEHFSSLRENEKGTVVGAPSLVFFAEKVGASLSDIERWRAEHSDFDRACGHAFEVLRQLLIDAALSERVNVSAAKFLLSSEFGMAPGGKGGGRDKEEAEALSEGDRALLANLWERLSDAKGAL